MPRTRSFRRVTVALAATAGLLVSLTSPAAATAGDLNGDGRDELVIGAPDEDLGSAPDAGVVHILRGAANGPTTARDVILGQRSFGGAAEASDRFGGSIAAGDFDGDGRDDLALGAAAEDLFGLQDTGVVHVVYGSSAGLVGRNTLLSQRGAVAGKPAAGDFFGASLAVGNLNGDRYDDLVVGVPGKDLRNGTRIASGAIVVIYGSARGLRGTGSKLFSQVGRITGVPTDFDAFGVALATGDLNGDGIDDVAVGSPGKAIGGQPSAGRVHVLFGSASGVRAVGNVVIDQSDAGGTIEAGDAFGRAVAIGDFDDDGTGELVISATGEDTSSGAVSIFDAGTTGGRTIAPGSAGVPGSSQTGAEWGRSLAVGDFNGDADDDLAVGAPFAAASGLSESGTVTIIGGDPAGLGTPGGFIIDQAAIAKTKPGAGDQLGWALRAGDYNGDGVADLAIAARGDDRRNADSGIVHVLPGRTGQSLDPRGSTNIWQGLSAIGQRPEAGDRLGTGL